MFTGIIESIGTIAKIEKKSGDAELTFKVGQLGMSDVSLGDSIACNGVCLTAIKLNDYSFVADISNETLRLTTLGSLAAGSKINLEKALTPTTRLGGHLVSGHVDGIGEIMSIKKDSRSVQYKVQAPIELAHYIAKKGSICVDGVSLTVNEITDNIFELNLVPHTLNETTASDYKVGTKINLEVDLLARYLERLLTGQKTEPESSLNKKTKTSVTTSFLKNNGFA